MGRPPINDENLRFCKAAPEDWDDPHTPRLSSFNRGALKGGARRGVIPAAPP